MATKKKQPSAIVKKQAMGITVGTVAELMEQALRTMAQVLSDELTPVQQAAAVQHIRSWSKDFEAYEKMLKERIVEYLKQSGQRDPETTRVFDVPSGLAIHAYRSGTDPKKLEKLLRAKGFNPERGMDAVITYKVNDRKVADLLTTSTLTQAELDVCKYDESWVLETPETRH